MAITKFGDDGFIFTDEHTRIHQLISMRGALKLKKLGMKHSRGSVRALVRKMDGCPKTMDFDKLMAFLTERIES